MAEEGWGEEDDGWGEEVDQESSCDYGCSEFCEDPQTKDMGACTTECDAYLCSVEAEADGGTSTWKCTECGCTDLNACAGGCSWKRKNLCSQCAAKKERARLDFEATAKKTPQ